MDRTQALSRKRRHSSRQGAGPSQEEEEAPPRSRLRASRMPSRTSSSSVEIVDVTPLPATRTPIAEDEPIDLSNSICVVDLTDETETTLNLRNALQDDVVDLTNVPDTERVPYRRRRRRGRRVRTSQRGNSVIPVQSDDSDEENDIMVLPEVDICNTHRAAREEANASGTDRPRPNYSPKKRAITCPICMEDEATLRNNGQQLMSTNCGHVFCNRCIRVSIQTQHRCPTCRKRLTTRQIHPIFL